MVLNQLQETLSDLYSLPVNYSVNDFLVTSASAAKALATAQESTDETFLIVESGDEAEVALYLDRELVDRLQRDNPTQWLTTDNMADFLAALEGVSHFVCYSWHADQDKALTLLEMELQAEVDKFVTAASLLAAQHGQLPKRLHRWLFELPQLAARLRGERQQRYMDANRLAGRYCLDLHHRLRRGVEIPELIPELRAFYRATQHDKIERIRALRCRH